MEARECVVLLHGLGRTARSMHKLERALAGAGYCVVNEAYPSTRQPIGKLVAVVDEGIRKCRDAGAESIHFVTHSLGSILVRAYFQNRELPAARRVVMLGPPNHGSEVVDRNRNAPWFRWMTGPAGQELGTDAASVPNRLGPISLEIGVIAGTASADPWFRGIVPTPNDGKVSVVSAKLPGMRDFMLVDSSHTFMMRSTEVIRQVLAFLRDGRFDHGADAKPG